MDYRYQVVKHTDESPAGIMLRWEDYPEARFAVVTDARCPQCWTENDMRIIGFGKSIEQALDRAEFHMTACLMVWAIVDGITAYRQLYPGKHRGTAVGALPSTPPR